MGKISVVINTLNEEKNLPRALASIRQLADEIVVCDMYSDDKTVEIAKKAGAKVYRHKKTGYVEPARNFAISKAEGDWILILDADEKISSRLGLRLRKIVKNPEADYYRLPRKNIIFGKWIKFSGWWPDYNIRFFKKGFVKWSEIIHSVPETKGRGLDLKAKRQNTIIHYHYDSIEEYLERLNRYTSVQARRLYKDKYKFTWSDLIEKPVKEFLNRFFAHRGYKDGVHGLSLALLQAFSEFVLYLKLWQLGGFKKDELLVREFAKKTRDIKAEVCYWLSDVLVKEGAGVAERIRRKLRI